MVVDTPPRKNLTPWTGGKGVNVPLEDVQECVPLVFMQEPPATIAEINKRAAEMVRLTATGTLIGRDCITECV